MLEFPCKQVVLNGVECAGEVEVYSMRKLLFLGFGVHIALDPINHKCQGIMRASSF